MSTLPLPRFLFCLADTTFLPYGPGIGDDEMSSDGAKVRNASVPIVFFRQEHQEIFVSTHNHYALFTARVRRVSNQYGENCWEGNVALM